jgi:HAD superfamily hydrolase (TIGR01509 family)
MTALPAAVFWDMDGTLIDSDPYWLLAEQEVMEQHGGTWDEDLPRLMQGASLPYCSHLMHERGVNLPENEIADLMVSIVVEREREQLPWTAGVVSLLEKLAEAKVPSVLVTGSPRWMARNAVSKAPRGAFVGYVCGEDDVAHKPDPAPYLRAADIARVSIKDSLIFEDSLPGLTSAANSGAVTVAVTRYSREDTSDTGLFSSSVFDYEGLTLSDLARFMVK